jgi:N-methylhydantoinase B/oxoprolinase/acetone carboxylase alpha subunit
MIEIFPVESMRPGDMFATNDPWMCAGHLDDIAVITPIFRDGRVVAFANTIAHTSSIGGALDGLRVRDLHEEGLFIPPLKLYDQGRPNETAFAFIRTNVRQPEMVLTDIESQVTANELAAQRVLAFMDEYRLDTLADLSRAVQSRAEIAMRTAIDAIPNGRYEAEEWMEGVNGPIPLRAAITVDGDSLHVDYAGTGPQTIAGGISCAFIYTRAHTVYPLKSILTPRIPSNEGCFRPIQIDAPERSILNALPPASVNSRTKTGWHLHTLIFRALSGVLPEQVQSGNGLMYNVRAYARDLEGTPHHASIIAGGGRGAGFGVDGMTRNCYPSSASAVAAEIIENRVPVLIEEDTLMADSGGRGRWRGSPGQRMSIRRRPGHELPVSIFIHPDRLRFPSPGLLGGEAGQKNVVFFNGENLAPDGALTTGEIFLDSDDDRFTAHLAGGGGYGPADQRDPAAIQQDIEYGYVTKDGWETSRGD